MDKILFSERLINRRKECGYKTQYALANEYNKRFPSNRKNQKEENRDNTSGILGTIKHYENANHKGSPNLEIVVNLCELLDCDIDYLTGKIDCKKHDIQFIQDTTGLSENTIGNLMHLTTFENGQERLAVIDYLLNDNDFTHFLTDKILQYYEKYTDYQTGLTKYNKNEKLNPIELKKKMDSEEYKPTITRSKLNEYKNSIDATQFLIQNSMREISTSLVEYFYNKNYKMG